MRPLPGRKDRVGLADPPAGVTRSNAAADQRRRILRAVGELVAKRGYGEVTVELIVRRAHVSAKTFYKHFSGKEQCFLALFDNVVRSTESIIGARLAAEQLAWPEQVALALRILIERIVAEPIIARAVIVEAPALGPGILERYERATKAFVPVFRSGRESKGCRAELPETAEDTLSGAVFWSAYQHLIVGEADRLPELLPELVELVLRTYLGPFESGRVLRANRELSAETSFPQASRAG